MRLPWPVNGKAPAIDYNIRQSDHVCFDDNGVDYICALGTGDHIHLHELTDTIETIELEKVWAVAEILWYAMHPMSLDE